MPNLAKYVVALEAQTAQYVAELQKANTELAKFHRDQTQALDSIKTAFKSFTQLFTVGVAVNYIKGVMEATEQTRVLALRLGTTTEYLSKMRYAANQSGVDFDEFTHGLQIMERQIGLVSRGVGGEAAKAFEALGVSVEGLMKLRPEQQFEVIAARLHDLYDPTTRMAVASQIFGRNLAMVQLIMDDNGQAIGNLTKEAEQLGIVLSSETAEKVHAATDAMDRLKASVDALALNALPALAHALEVVATGWNAILFGNVSPVPFENQIDALKTKLQAMRAQFDSSGGMGSKWLNDFSKQMVEVQKQIEELIKKQRQALGLDAPETGAGTAAAGVSAVSPFFNTQAAIDQWNEFLSMRQKKIPPPLLARPGSGGEFNAQTGVDQFGSPDALQKSVVDAKMKNESDFTKFYEKELLKRQRADIDAWNVAMEAEKQAHDQKIALNMNVVDSVAGFLQVLGEKHRGAAIAAIAIERVKTIMQLHLASLAAQGQIMASTPPYAWPALLTAVRIRFGIMEALAAATGIVEAAQISSGGSGPGSGTLGTSANPIVTTSASSSSAADAQKRSAVQIIFQGDVFGWDETMKKRIVDSLRDLIDNKDVVIIGQNSRQALQLGGG